MSTAPIKHNSSEAEVTGSFERRKALGDWQVAGDSAALGTVGMIHKQAASVGFSGFTVGGAH
eukprot:5261249-Alexandrium_andersonii.AAC.1